MTLNSNRFIDSCLESIKNQTHDNIEHIVVDGGSTDGTLSKIKSKPNKISALISEPDNGI